MILYLIVFAMGIFITHTFIENELFFFEVFDMIKYEIKRLFRTKKQKQEEIKKLKEAVVKGILEIMETPDFEKGLFTCVFFVFKIKQEQQDNSLFSLNILSLNSQVARQFYDLTKGELLNKIKDAYEEISINKSRGIR